MEANRDTAVAIQSEEVYERYMKYLRGCERYFTEEILDVSLVTYLKPGATTSTGSARSSIIGRSPDNASAQESGRTRIVAAVSETRPQPR